MKTRDLFRKELKKVPQHIKDQVEKMMTCAHLYDSNMCRIGGQCNPKKCTSWKHYEHDMEGKED